MDKEVELRLTLGHNLEEEYKKFIEELKQKEPEQIVERAREKVIKEDIVYVINDENYPISVLKALVKKKNLLQEYYEKYLEDNCGDIDNIQDVLHDISFEISEEYKENRKKEKNR